MSAHGVSVVIPVLNEAEQLTRNVPAVLHGQPPEVIVVDGGSTDRSREIARSFGAIVLRAEQGRGRQLNAGAQYGLFRVSWANLCALARFLLTKHDAEPSITDAPQRRPTRPAPMLPAQVIWERAQ